MSSAKGAMTFGAILLLAIAGVFAILTADVLSALTDWRSNIDWNSPLGYSTWGTLAGASAACFAGGVVCLAIRGLASGIESQERERRERESATPELEDG